MVPPQAPLMDCDNKKKKENNTGPGLLKSTMTHMQLNVTCTRLDGSGVANYCFLCKKDSARACHALGQ